MFHIAEITPAENATRDGLSHLVAENEPGMTSDQTDYISYDPIHTELVLGERYVVTVGRKIKIVTVDEASLIDFYTGARIDINFPYRVYGQITQIGRSTRY